MSPELREAHLVLFQRYLGIMARYQDINIGKTSLQNLTWMCETAIEQIDALPVDKLSRWLGFVQGVLAGRNFIDVDEEREFSRPLFHAAYGKDGGTIPPTLERS